MPLSRIRVFVAEDYVHARFGLAAFLNSLPDLEIVPPEATDPVKAQRLPNTIEQTVQLVQQCRPDVVIMDVHWGEDDNAGIEAARQIQNSLPHTRVILWTFDHARKQLLRAVLQCRPDGYVFKDGNDTAALPDAIRAVFHRRLPYYVPEVVRDLLVLVRTPSLAILSPSDLPEPLDALDIQVLKLMACGLTNQAIAEQLNFTEPWVRQHVMRIYDRLEVRDSRLDVRITAVLRGLPYGYLELGDLIPPPSTKG